MSKGLHERLHEGRGGRLSMKRSTESAMHSMSMMKSSFCAVISGDSSLAALIMQTIIASMIEERTCEELITYALLTRKGYTNKCSSV